MHNVASSIHHLPVHLKCAQSAGKNMRCIQVKMSGVLRTWEGNEHGKVILCISKSYPNRLTSNTNTILFPRFARILSPTFLIAFKAGMQTKCTRRNVRGTERTCFEETTTTK